MLSIIAIDHMVSNNSLKCLKKKNFQISGILYELISIKIKKMGLILHYYSSFCF